MRFLIAIVFLVWLVLATMSTRIFRGSIEAQLTGRAESALASLGLDGVEVRFDHLDATLSGTVSNRRQKEEAAAAVEGIAGARVMYNHIAFGQARAPALTFVQGERVQVSGWLDESDGDLDLGGEFDIDGVELTDTAPAPWRDGVAEFAQAFFAEATGGRIEMVGRWISLEGEVPNRVVKWRMLDHADGLHANLDVLDRLKVAEPRPFALSGHLDGDLFRFEGVVRDERVAESFREALAGADVGAISIDPRASSPPWLISVPSALGHTADLAISASVVLGPDRCAITATFATAFWAGEAKRQLLGRVPERFYEGFDFRVAQKAIPEGSDSRDDSSSVLPIRISISEGEIHVEGKVRRRDEREALLASLAASRPDLEVTGELRYDHREPEMAAVRAALPGLLAFFVSGISDSGVVDLNGDRWELSGICGSETFLSQAGRVSSILRDFAGLPLEVDLRLRPDPRAVAGERLLDYPFYFKPGSAQITPLQQDKVQALAEILAHQVGLREILLIGIDAGDGALALQRGRALRRALEKAGVGGGSLNVGKEEAPLPLDWRGESVVVELGARLE